MAGERRPGHSTSPGTARFRLGRSIVADPVRHVIVRDGRAAAIEPRVMQLLAYLAERPGQIISKAELREQVWRAHVVDEAVHRAVSLLRSSLGDSPRRPTIVETVPRHGYRLMVVPTPYERTASHRPARSIGAAAAVAAIGSMALFLAPGSNPDPAAAPAPEVLTAGAGPAIAQHGGAEPHRTSAVASAAPESREQREDVSMAAAPEAPAAAGKSPGVASLAPPAPAPAAPKLQPASGAAMETPRATQAAAPSAPSQSAAVADTPLADPARD